MNIVKVFIIRIEDEYYIVQGGTRVLINRDMYLELQEKGIPTLYYSDIANLG